ncbi:MULTISPECIES: vWA domain-containing protein [Terrisporobacter]|uniref:VWA domain-containing protein n=1 Tax=Terrisporobacter muris TaxID=2963284 RepID=A0A9X2MEM9_9FIRM|nr:MULTISPECIES: vWA domain-containing protein [Terrisporobacter]MCR1822561.1 VWA domain-containing protein [Terrisporobacter muris]MDY3372609.1 vWA domain-containing protein [Terrisporobacter othiniensis]
MKNNLTEVVFILDRSGSMSGLEGDTIGGFNSMLKKQREEEGDANVTTVLFDDEIEMLHKRVNIKEIKNITSKDYYVRGCTALLDAIGYSINFMINVQKNKKQEKAKNVLFIITTDGYENASKEYSYEKIKKMITYEKERYNWQFLFLGANIDAISTARNFGISEEFASNYVSDEVGTQITYEVMNSAISNCRVNGAVDESWKSRVEEDYEMRKE